MNQLSQKTLPYLLQHTHNPMHWYAWKLEVFESSQNKIKK